MSSLQRLVSPFTAGRFLLVWWLGLFAVLALLYGRFLFPAVDGKLIAFGDWPAAVAAANFTGEGLRAGYPPLATDVPIQRTSLFWGVPEFPCFPFSVAFLFGPALGYFGLLLFCLALGLWAACHLSLRLRLSPLASLVPVAVTFLGGPFVSHYAVGHFMWQGLLFAPLAVLLVLDQRRVPPATAAVRWGFFVLLLLALGSLHVAVWFTAFYVLAAVAERRWWLAFGALACVVVFGAFRILPAAYAYAWEAAPALAPSPGFPTLDALLASVVLLRPAHYFPHPPGAVPFAFANQWEFSMFASVSLAGILVVAVVVGWRSRHFRRCLLPLAVLALASFSFVYVWVCDLPLPLATFQRIPSRFFAVVLLFSSWLLGPVLQLFARRFPGWFAFAVVLGLHDLLVHLSWYSVRHLVGIYAPQTLLFPLPVTPPSGFVVVSACGLALSAVSVCAAAYLASRLSRRSCLPRAGGFTPKA